MVATCVQARVASTSFTIQFPMARGKKAETNGIEWKPRGNNRVAFYPGNDSNQAPVVIEQEVKGTVVRNFLHGREDKKYGYGLHVEIGVEDTARIKGVIATDHLSTTRPQYKWPVSEHDNVARFTAKVEQVHVDYTSVWDGRSGKPCGSTVPVHERTGLKVELLTIGSKVLVEYTFAGYNIESGEGNVGCSLKLKSVWLVEDASEGFVF